MKNLRIFFWFSIITAIATLLSSCGGSVPEQSKYIPGDAIGLLSINTQSIKEKSTNYSELFKQMDAPELRKLGDDIDKTGIDLDASLFIFAAGDSKDRSSMYAGGILAVKDQAKFIEYFKGEMDGVEFADENGIQIAYKQPTMVGVKENTAIFLSGQGMDEAGLKEKLTGLFTGEGDLLETNQEASDLLGQGADISAWVSADGLSMASMFMPLDASNEGLMKGSSITMTANFEKGQIVTDTKVNLNEEAAALVNGSLGTTSSDVAENVAGSESPILVSAFTLNFDKAFELINTILGDEQILENALTEMQLTKEEIKAAFTGEFVVVLNSINKEKMDFNGALTVGIKDKAKVDAIMKKYEQMGVSPVEGGYSVGGQYPITLNDKAMIVFASDALQKSFNEGNATLSGDMNNQLTSNSLYVYLNSTDIPFDMAPREVRMLEGSPVETIEASTKDLNTRVIIGLKDKEKNSLDVLMESANAEGNETQSEKYMQ